ncbi:MAG: hypothetical protein QM689_04310 [Oscillospiraceae bacterium]
MTKQERKATINRIAAKLLLLSYENRQRVFAKAKQLLQANENAPYSVTDQSDTVQDISTAEAATGSL